MAICKQCGKDFRYDDEVGYAADLCGPFCDGVNSQQPKIERIANERDSDMRRLTRWLLELVGEGIDGCLTGDCPHSYESDCVDHLLELFESDTGR